MKIKYSRKHKYIQIGRVVIGLQNWSWYYLRCYGKCRLWGFGWIEITWLCGECI